MRAFIILLAACSVATAAPTDLERFNAWEIDTGRTTTPMQLKWQSDAKEVLLQIKISSVVSPSALAEIKAYTQEMIDAASKKPEDQKLATLRQDADFRANETRLIKLLQASPMDLVPDGMTNLPSNVTEKQMKRSVLNRVDALEGTQDEAAVARLEGRLYRISQWLKLEGHPDLSKCIKHTE